MEVSTRPLITVEVIEDDQLGMSHHRPSFIVRFNGEGVIPDLLRKNVTTAAHGFDGLAGDLRKLADMADIAISLNKAQDERMRAEALAQMTPEEVAS